VSDGVFSQAPQVPGYRLVEAIGSGASGVVWRAEATDGLARPFAVKLFPPGERERYLREVETLRAIEAARSAAGSVDLVETVAADEVEGHGYVVMEYVRGGSLAERVRALGPLPPPEAVSKVRSVLRGLSVLHDAGLIHKDVKPANILVGDDGTAKLGDFGLARPLESPVSSAGTPGFCAPELYAGRTLDAGGERLDVYSSAATLYYLLTGEAPLPGRPDLFLLERRQVDRALQGVLFEALAEDPARRTASAAALAERLAQWSEGRLESPRQRGGRRWAVAALLAVVGASLAAVLAFRSPPPPLWDGRVLALAGPAVAWDGGEVWVAGRGWVAALGGAPAATGRDAAGATLAAIGPRGEAVAVDMAGEVARVLFRSPGVVGSDEPAPLCAVATDGRFLARLVASLEPGGPERLEVFDLAAGARVREEQTAHGACALALAPGPTLLLGTPDGRVGVLGPEAVEPRWLRTHGDELRALAVDEAVGHALVLGDDRSLQALDEGGGDGVVVGDQVLAARPDLKLKVYALKPLLVGRLELISEREVDGRLYRGALP
jgi:hypothetical protein